jgi:hypothetical protein
VSFFGKKRGESPSRHPEDGLSGAAVTGNEGEFTQDPGVGVAREAVVPQPALAASEDDRVLPATTKVRPQITEDDMKALLKDVFELISQWSRERGQSIPPAVVLGQLNSLVNAYGTIAGHGNGRPE